MNKARILATLVSAAVFAAVLFVIGNYGGA